MVTSGSRFSSERERRLWGWTLAVVVAIYSTLGLAATLAGALRERGVIDALFVGGFLLVVAAILTHGLRVRPGGAEVVVGLGVAAAYLMVFVRMSISAEERTHLIEYGVVAVLIREALAERASRGRHVPVPALLAVLATMLIGVVDEGIQWLVPRRVFDPFDIFFNVVAAVMAMTASGLLGWARGKVG